MPGKKGNAMARWQCGAAGANQRSLAEGDQWLKFSLREFIKIGDENQSAGGLLAYLPAGFQKRQIDS